MADEIFSIAFASAYTAIFEIGSVMAVLMLVFGIISFKKGDDLRRLIERHKLDRPVLMALLALIPIDGTLLFQYNLYRQRSIRPGSLLGGMIGIGEEASYIILSYQPLAWLALALIKLLTALTAGTIFNKLPAWQKKAACWLEEDLAADADQAALDADKNFHALPDRFRHKLHHFRYHTLGMAFWVFFALAFTLQMALALFTRLGWYDEARLEALGIPFTAWLSMLALIIVVFYFIVVRFTTREFGKIFPDEFEDTGDAIGDLAEVCASIILLIFVLTFLVQILVASIGIDQIALVFAGRGILAVGLAALLGLIPGTGASLAFTSLYFNLAGTSSALPFASLVACSIALIGDMQLLGRIQLKRTQKYLHLISFGLALVLGLVVLGLEQLF